MSDKSSQPWLKLAIDACYSSKTEPASTPGEEPMSDPAEAVPPTQGAVRPRSPFRPFGPVLGWLFRKAFSSVRIAPGSVDHLRELSEKGTVVYVMRQRSLVDFVLVTTVFLREGLPPPEFATGLSTFWLRPITEVVAALWRRMRHRKSRELRDFEDRERCQRLVSRGRPVLVFMRGPLPRMSAFRRRRRDLRGMRTGSDYLREIVHHLWSSGQEVALVPVAVLRGRGMRRKESRLATLVYSVQEVPGEIRRLVSLLWNRRGTSISLGVEVQLHEFTRQYRREGEERIVRRLTRALQIFLYREERLVWGPLLLPKRQVRHRVLEDEEVRLAVRNLARERGQSEAQIRRQAERYFNEMAANFHGIYFSILEFVFNRVWPRLFHGLEYWGLDRVVERMKQHPVVLVPCHRSHFDYLILSYLFHLNYLSPPHIAAGINLSFWPLGPLFRGAGAYFIRRSFEGNELYKVVFRRYLTFLIREGYTQEFFIEGGRSRTGKILTPKLGMLSAIVDAFAEGVRRDLYLVPISIHYGRVVEEDEYQRELGGGEKQPESLSGLLRARNVLRRRHGTVYITFAEPISLNSALGERRERFRQADDGANDEKRRFVRKLGFRLLREVNAVSVAGATSISATVLLGLQHRACRQVDFVRKAQALVDYLRTRGVRLTASLERNAESEFRESLSFLEHGGLIQRLAPEQGGIILIPSEKRLALDFYKNNTIHFFLLPALATGALSCGLRGGELSEDVAWWLDFLRWEFPLPERERISSETQMVLSYLRSRGAVTPAGDLILEDPFVASVRGILDNFRESYRVAAQVLLTLPAGGMPRKAVVDRMQKEYRTGLLLGEVRQMEGSSSMTFGNALSRYEELDCVRLRAGKGREPIVEKGDDFERLSAIAQRIVAGMVRV
jgi:glycerol-3-phosphate O-acyltransferase